IGIVAIEGGALHLQQQQQVAGLQAASPAATVSDGNLARTGLKHTVVRRRQPAIDHALQLAVAITTREAAQLGRLRGKGEDKCQRNQRGGSIHDAVDVLRRNQPAMLSRSRCAARTSCGIRSLRKHTSVPARGTTSSSALRDSGAGQMRRQPPSSSCQSLLRYSTVETTRGLSPLKASRWRL